MNQCKDCKYYKEYAYKNIGRGHCKVFEQGVRAEDGCEDFEEDEDI